MSVDLDNFLHSLCLAIATATGLEYAGTPRALWAGRVIEGADCAATYAVATIYGGPAQLWDPLARVSVQVMARGPAALATAQKIFEALHTSDGRPWRMQTIDGTTVAGAADGHWRIVSVDFSQRPGVVSTDDNGRDEAVFNMEIGFAKVS